MVRYTHSDPTPTFVRLAFPLPATQDSRFFTFSIYLRVCMGVPYHEFRYYGQDRLCPLDVAGRCFFLELTNVLESF
jgi:hypothetical protein